MSFFSRLACYDESHKSLRVSFEFFPPKTKKMETALWKTVESLAPLSPQFVSITYGAGGSTRERTVRILERIVKETKLVVAAHLTCVDASRSEVDRVAQDFSNLGIRHFVALRGDPSNSGCGVCESSGDRYVNAADLVAGLKKINTDFEISVSAYPEKHPESPDFATDIDFLKRKIDNGATRAITQAFFDNEYYERYVEKVRAAGIYIPILPGILPIYNFWRIENFCKRNGTFIPSWISRCFEGLEQSSKTHMLVAAVITAGQVLDLVKWGISDFHFYTLNQADLVHAICRLIGIRASRL